MIDKILVRFIKITAALALFAPLYVDSSFIFPYVFPKTALFQVFVEIMFFAWLILMVGRPEFRPRRSRIVWAIGLFLTIVFLASLFGVNFQLSFWSSYERMTGLITMLHYFAFFLVLTSVLKTKKDWLMIFDFFIGASILLSLFGLGQRFGVQGLLMSGEGRVSATFGNPAYFSAYLIFALVAVVFMFFQRPGKGRRYYYALVFALHFVILYWTETRGALLGFGAALLLFLTALVFWPKDTEEKEAVTRFKAGLKKTAKIILAVFVVLLAIFLAARNTAFVKNSPTLNRLAVISISETTTQTRLLAWKLSWQGFKDRPILGWGWENYNVVFNKYYDPHLFPVENWFDRAHNIVFDTLVSTGAFGFIAYLGIFAAVFMVLWRAFRQKRIDFLNAVLFAVLFVAYFVQDLFVFDMLYSYMPLFMILAFINWFDKKDALAQEKKTVVGAKMNFFGLAAVIAAFIFVIYFVNIKPAVASDTAIYGLGLAQSAQQDPANAATYERRALDQLKIALGYGTFGRFEARLQMFETGKTLMDGYRTAQDKKAIEDFIDFALAEGDKTAIERPTDARYLLSIGGLNLQAASYRPERLAIADGYLEKAYQLSPTKQIILFALGEAKIRQGKNEEGLRYLQKAVDINKDAMDSQWNLALIYFVTGDTANGNRILLEMEKQFGNFYTVDHYQKIASLLAQNNKFTDAIYFQRKAIGLQPNSADLYATLAGMYAQAGAKPDAKEAALKVVELNPSMKDQVDQFIKSLGL